MTGTVRDYAVLYLGPGGKKVATVGGGNAVITAGQHRLDGTEHLAPADTTTLDATASAHGLLPKLSGDAGDALLGDGTWGAIASTGYVTNIDGGKEVVSTVAAAGATETLDLADGNVHDVTLTEDCTLTFAGATAGVACSFTLVLRQDGTGGWTTTWPGSVVWAGGTAPTLDETLSTLAVLTFFTLDGGTIWYGFPTGGGGASIGATVEDETTFGITPDAGASTDASAADHTHGSPANPVTVAALEALGVRGELVVVDGTTGPTGVIPSSYVEMTTPDTTTSASLEDITGATTTITIQRPSDIAVWMTAHVSAGAVCDLGLAINIDGTDHDATTTHLTATDEGNVAIMHRTVSKFAPGTYTVKGRMQRVSGGGTPSVDRVDLLVSALTTSGPVLVTTDDETDYVYADLA